MSWRSEARNALRAYPRIKHKQALLTEQQITPVYGGTVVQHSATRVTENVALRSPLTAREESIISAVEFMTDMQSRYYNAEARMRMVKLVYYNRTHTLNGAAEVVGYNINSVRNWNTEILMAVYAIIKKKD